MRNFSFDLRLPGGGTTRVDLESPCKRWSDAFTRACRMAEATHGIPPFTELVCVDYRATPVA